MNRYLTFDQESAGIIHRIFFALVKGTLLAVILIAAVLVAGQSKVAPVSVNLLTTYAMEYAVTTFKPYRVYFPEPYLIQFNTK